MSKEGDYPLTSGKVDFQMKNRLPLILILLTILMLSMTSCFRAYTSTPDESVTQMPEPVVEIPPVEQTTPNWMYAIIGIGTALAVTVTVYIIRSRKP